MVKKSILIICALMIAGCVKGKEVAVEESKDKGALETGKKVVMIIASSNFRDEEYSVPRQILEDQGIEVKVASSSLKESIGMLGARVKPDLLLSQVNMADYDGVIFVGGIGAKEYWRNHTAHGIAQEALNSDKVLAAICLAPVILANAGVLKEKKATVYPSEGERLKEAGANYTGAQVEVDSKIVTANGPQVSAEFGQIVASLIAPK